MEVYQYNLIKEYLEALKIINRSLLIDANGLKIIAYELIAIALNFLPELILKNDMIYKKDTNIICCAIIILHNGKNGKLDLDDKAKSMISYHCERKNAKIMKAILMGTSECCFICFNKKTDDNFSVSKPFKYIDVVNGFLNEFQNFDAFFRRLIGFLGQ